MGKIFYMSIILCKKLQYFQKFKQENDTSNLHILRTLWHVIREWKTGVRNQFGGFPVRDNTCLN